ncbi:hypothetical protein [Roseateles chitinivorans]|uniref:hypothetical protein n=1 Tax=Roseateles chitinivorans TaxID=2917965 RepID=UPI003D66BCDC
MIPLTLSLSAAFGGLSAIAAPADDAASTSAQTSALTSAATLAQIYQQPSEAIRAVLDAKALPVYQVSPDQRTLAIVVNRKSRAIAELARPVLRQAGLRYDPATDSPQLITTIESLSLRPSRTARAASNAPSHCLRAAPSISCVSRRTANASC